MASTQVALGFPSGANLFRETVIGATALTVKNSAGTIHYFQVDNMANAAISYLKLYFTNAAVTVGTTVPDLVIPIPASTKRGFPIPDGLAFGSGLQAACVTTGGTGGVTAPTASTDLQVIYV